MPIKSQKTQLQTIVTLYRAFGKPSLIEKNSFSATAIASTEIIDAIKDCQALSPSCGRFDEVLVNGKEQRADQALKVGDEISIRWLLSTNGQIPFYRDYCHLLESRTSIYKGSAPDFYYVSDEDFINDEVSCSQTSQRLQKLCQVIECLSVIAQYHDEKSTSDTFRLVFIVPESETKPHQPIVLDTKFRMSDLAGPEIDISTIQEIATAISSEETHAQEKAGLFRLCLADIIESTPEACSSFSYLIQEWPTLLQKYKQSYETYISGFAFNRVRSELAKVEVEIASSLSKALNDITTKLLSIPISFAALLTMSKLESIEENVIFPEFR
ncbi:MAG: hypothetical protein AWU56_2317 [Idiomarina sp. T82-3]|uniref:hypothetical protein n=1 Tax=Idiomarina TaxID=135575 RepID=UPI000795FB4D|nr:hypothetical protein [Idiomarina sp. T82-3]KXS34071.1 MAG: hypothetical protein AWU56_2317 [Idiomarina sp. T82-3]